MQLGTTSVLSVTAAEVRENHNKVTLKCGHVGELVPKLTSRNEKQSAVDILCLYPVLAISIFLVFLL